jgi:hypothetical protein
MDPNEIHDRLQNDHCSWSFFGELAVHLVQFNDTIRDTLLAHPDAFIDQEQSTGSRIVLREGNDIVAEWSFPQFPSSDEIGLQYQQLMILEEYAIPNFKTEWFDEFPDEISPAD